MNDVELAKVNNAGNKSYLLGEEEEDEIWLGEPSAHLNHVVAYHQVVREQMQATVDQLQKVHKEVCSSSGCSSLFIISLKIASFTISLALGPVFSSFFNTKCKFITTYTGRA